MPNLRKVTIIVESDGETLGYQVELFRVNNLTTNVKSEPADDVFEPVKLIQPITKQHMTIEMDLYQNDANLFYKVTQQ